MKNTKAESLWEKLEKKQNFHLSIKKFRQENGIPEGGFASESEYKAWWMQMFERGAVFGFLDHIKLLAKQFQVKGLNEVIERYAVRGEVESYFIETANTTGCEFIYIDEDITSDEMPRLELGSIYIKISPEARISDIELFLEQHKDSLARLQGDIKKTKFKTSRRKERDNKIYKLNKLSVEKLQAVSGSSSKRKDVLIASILGQEGQLIQADNVRRIIAKEKELVTNKRAY